METTALPLYFGEWVKRRRKELDLTQTELAERAGCSVPALRKIEAGARRPSKQLAGLLAKSLDIPPEDHPTFIKVARGELNVERIYSPPLHRTADPVIVRHSPLARNNLPSQTSPLIGREAELAALGKLLADPNCRLLTLKGLGGIGKTRLAIEAASANQELFPDGVTFVDLAALSSPSFIASAITDALGLNLAGPQDPQKHLLNALQEKRLLFVLDNVEHLIDDVGLFAEMLKCAPSLKLLVTSRERLNLQGEWVFDIQGLPLPPDELTGQAENYSSVRLFIQRARQAQAKFELSSEEQPWAVSICRNVEGIPLGIELAAAWIPILTCKEIAQEIKVNLDFLATKVHGIPTRQHSLRATFDHSWKLLSNEERRSLSRLAIFRGGFLQDAAQQVATANLHILLSLVDKSLLKRTADGRYYLHELVRQYAWEKLSESPEELLADQDRHCAFYMNYVGGLEPDLKSHSQLEAISKISAEIENIRTAWRHAVNERPAELIRKPITGLVLYYDTRGRLKEAETTLGWAAEELERRIEAEANADPRLVIAREHIRTFQGFFLLCLGKLEEAKVILQDCLDTLRGLEARQELKDVFNYLGSVELLLGNYTHARDLFLEELEFATQSADHWNEAYAYYNLGLVARALGEYREADNLFQMAVAFHMEIGDRRRAAISLLFLGDVKRSLGEYQEANTRLLESVELNKPLSDSWTYGMALSELGLVARDQGEYTDAVRLLRQGLALLREINECYGVLQALNGLGSVMLVMKNYAEAQTCFSEAVNISTANQFAPETLEALVGLADLLSHTEAYEKANRILVNILENPALTQETKERAKNLHNEIASHLTFQEMDKAPVRDQTKALNEVIAEVLQAR